MIKTLIVMIPLALFMAWYSHNTNQSMENFARQKYVQCLNQTLDNAQAQKNCELINPDNKYMNNEKKILEQILADIKEAEEYLLEKGKTYDEVMAWDLSQNEDDGAIFEAGYIAGMKSIERFINSLTN